MSQGEEMARGMRSVGGVCLGLAALALLLAGVVSATLIIGPVTTGSTSIWNFPSTGCSASVTPIASGNFPVNNGDDIKFYYNFTYSDTRSGPNLQVAHHYFNMTIAYSRASGDQFTFNTYDTQGTSSGSDSLNLTVYNVLKPATIYVTGIAQVSGACSAYDAETGVLTLV